MGLHGEIFVTPEGSWSRQGPVLEAPPLFRRTGTGFDEDLTWPQVSTAEWHTLVQTALPAALQAQPAEVSVPVLAWLLLTPVAPWVRRLANGRFPILNVWGTRGSGKTSYVEQVLRLLGFCQAPGEHIKLGSANASDFDQVKNLSAANALPVVLDEYKPGQLRATYRDALYRNIRHLYDGKVVERGLPDQTVRRYPLVAPLALLGEAPLEEPALVSRSIIVNPNPAVPKDPTYKARFRTLKGLPLEGFAAGYVTWLLGQDLQTWYPEVETETEAILARLGIELDEPRMVANLVTIVLGWRVIGELARAANVALSPVVLDKVVESLARQLVGDAGRAKTSLDKFFEEIETLISLGKVEVQKHFIVVGPWVHCHLAAMHEAWLEQKRKTGQDVEGLTLQALKTQARENERSGGYVARAEARVSIGEHRYRGIILDARKLQAAGLEPGTWMVNALAQGVDQYTVGSEVLDGVSPEEDQRVFDTIVARDMAAERERLGLAPNTELLVNTHLAKRPS